MSWLRTIAAFIAAPLVTPIVIGFFLFGGIPPSTRQMLGTFYLFAPFAYMAAIVLGIPVFALFRWLNWTNVLLFFAFGTLIGLGVSMVIMRHNPIEYMFTRHASDLAVCALAGGLSATAFRFIVLGFGRGSYCAPIRSET